MNHFVRASFRLNAENEKKRGTRPIVVTFPTNVSVGKYVRVAGLPKKLGKGRLKSCQGWMSILVNKLDGSCGLRAALAISSTPGIICIPVIPIPKAVNTNTG